MKIAAEMTVIRRQIEIATGRIVSETKPQKNLILDSGLNQMAGSVVPGLTMADSFLTCRIGSGTTPTSTASGAVTFTQSGTTITASANFFTSGMAGMLFKYGSGTGGAESYITVFTDATHVTVNVSATVASPTVATVWAVNQIALTTPSFSSTTYQTSGTSNQTTYAAPTMTHKRTFNFAAQVGSYNVNEIGWSDTVGHQLFGRLVLGSTDVVPPTNFYQVVLSLAFTMSPSSVTAVTNVGTNINVAGNAMLEAFGFALVQSNGTTLNRGVDAGPKLEWFGTTYTQLSTINNSTIGVTEPASSLGTAANWAYGGTLGLDIITIGYTFGTSGTNVFGLGIMGNTSGTYSTIFDVLFTTPQVTPNGTFSGTIQFNLLFGRNLSN